MELLNNPFSKKRFSKKEKFYRALTKKVSLLKPLLKEQDQPFGLLSSLYRGLQNSILDKDVSIPEGVNVDLLSITIADIIPVEESSQLNSGFKKLLKLYPPKFNVDDPTERIDDFFVRISSSVHKKNWSNFGNIQFDEKSEIGKYITSVHIEATQVSSSIIVLQYEIHPSSNYLSILKQIIDNNVSGESIFTPRNNLIFKYWGTFFTPSYIVKRRKLEDYILELKWMFFSLISNYLPTFFYKNEIVPPGILVYKIEHEFCNLDAANHYNSFWDSIGLSKQGSFYHGITKDGVWQVHSSHNQDDLDNSVSISANSIIPLEFLSDNSQNSQICIRSGWLINELLPIIALNEYTLFISKQIATFRISTFKAIKNTKIEYKKILRQRLTIEQNGHMLTRIKNEIENNDYNKMKDNIKGLFDWGSPNLWLENIVENTEYLISQTHTHSESLIKTIDNTVQILTIQTNFSLQRKTVLLTVVTIFLAIVAIYLTYYQISQESSLGLDKLLIDLLTKF